MEMLSKNYIDKIRFVNELSNVMRKYLTNIEKIDYYVFKHKADNYEKEYVVITYKGGAIAARNCTATSKSGIANAVSKMLEGGYYDEVADFKYYQHSDNFDFYNSEKILGQSRALVIDLDDIVCWIGEHPSMVEDFLRHFDVVDDENLSEDELEGIFNEIFFR